MIMFGIIAQIRPELLRRNEVLEIQHSALIMGVYVVLIFERIRRLARRHSGPREALLRRGLVRNALDDYLLELILMDSLVFASSRRIPDAERIIRSFIPSGSYDQIMQHYDGLSAEWADEETDLCAYWQRCAARKSSAWKQMMIERLLGIACHAGCVDCSGPSAVAVLARGMAAEQECRQVFARSLGKCGVAQKSCFA